MPAALQIVLLSNNNYLQRKVSMNNK